MYLKKISVAVACSAMMLTGCQDFELESTGIGAFKQAYEDYFVSQVGGISPDQSWDFSTAGGHRGQGEVTRAITVNADGWYYPETQTLDWMKNELQEQNDNSDKCKDFYLSWTPGMTFDIVPIYEGKATMDWELYMKVTPADGVGDDLYNSRIWSKGENVQLKVQDAVQNTKTNLQYEADEVVIWFEMNVHNGNMYIWPWREGVDNPQNGDYYTGSEWGACAMTHAGTRNNHNIYKWVCKKEYAPTHVEFIADYDGDKHKVGNVSYTFRNHGYYYEDNPSYAGESDGNSPLSLYTPPTPTEPYWKDFEGEMNAQYALGFRAKKIDIPSLASNSWPVGSIVSFYLKITNNHGLSSCADNNEVMSSLNQQIVYLDVPADYMPNNVDKSEGAITGIIGVEDSKITKSGSDKDYNDVVFLINGVMPEPVVIETNPSASTVPVEKRYMTEDLTNTGDMDFNDIVVDVKSIRWTYWRVNTTTNEKEVDTSHNGTETVNGQTLTFKNGICDVQTATVKHLCGTVPIRFKVGDTLLPWITNPVNAEMSKAQLESTFDGTVEYGKGNVATPGNNPDVTLTVTGWNPNTNNVVVYVGWDGATQTPTEPTTDSEGIVSNSNWSSGFPERGTVPCIIATDVTDMWTPECVDITETSWWKSNFIQSSGH